MKYIDTELNTNDYINIQTALRYVASNMNSKYFKEKFLDTLYKIIIIEEEKANV